MQVRSIDYILLSLSILTACAALDGFSSRGNTKTDPCFIYQNHPKIPATTGQKVAIDFFDQGRWSYGNGVVAGEGLLRMVSMPDGSYAGVFSQYAFSTKWKLYANPRTIAVFLDASGNPLHEYPYLHETVGAMNPAGPTPDQRRRTHRVMVPAVCQVAYVLFKFQFCGFKENDMRQNVATNCRGKYVGRQLMNLDTSDIGSFPEFVRENEIAIGDQFKYGRGWKGQRLR